MSAILTTIQRQLPSFNPKDRELAEYILHNAERIVQLSITELSNQSGASAATISRFCRMLHLGGYPDLKLKLAAELAQRNGTDAYQDIIAGNSLEQIIEAMEANHHRSITDTTRLLDRRSLEAAVTALHQAKRIDLYGMATSGIVAQDLAQKLVRIGKFAHAYTDPHMQITSASNLQEFDLAIAVSYSGETPEIIDAIQCAKDRGALTLSLTHFGRNTLASLCQITLFASSLEAGMRRGDMASRIAQLHVVDILFTALISYGFEDYIPRLELSYQLVSKYKRRKGRS